MGSPHRGADAPCMASPELATRVPVPAPLGAAAAAAGAVAQKDEAPRLAGAEGFKGQGAADTPDSAATAANDQRGEKHLTTLRAALACEGYALLDAPHSPHGAFTVTRWGMTTDLHDLAAVERFARRVGAVE